MAVQLAAWGLTDLWWVRVLIIGVLTTFYVGVGVVVVRAMKGRWWELIEFVKVLGSGYIYLLFGVLMFALFWYAVGWVVGLGGWWWVLVLLVFIAIMQVRDEQ